MKKSYFFLSIFILLNISCVNADTLVVPGQKIDGAFLNVDYYIIQKGWGEADDKQEVDGGVTVYRNKRHLTIFYVAQGRLAMIETFSSQFKTESGIKIGSHRQDVVASYGPPFDQFDYTLTAFDGKTRQLYCQLYTGEGIGFSYDPVTHNVYSIIVFPSGGYINVHR